jgi:hypothetical protein
VLQQVAEQCHEHRMVIDDDNFTFFLHFDYEKSPRVCVLQR